MAILSVVDRREHAPVLLGGLIAFVSVTVARPGGWSTLLGGRGRE